MLVDTTNPSHVTLMVKPARVAMTGRALRSCSKDLSAFARNVSSTGKGKEWRVRLCVDNLDTSCALMDVHSLIRAHAALQCFVPLTALDVVWYILPSRSMCPG
jgi:hypothetical protein